MKFRFLTLMLCFSSVGFSQQTSLFDAVDTPRIFAPDIISDGFANRDLALSPDGKEIFFTLQWYFGTYSVILHMYKTDTGWTKPDTAWFSGRFNDLEPAFSPDGNRIYFSSNRPVGQTGQAKNDYDIWFMQKIKSKWEGPFSAGDSVNTDRDEFYPSAAKSGSLYFTRNGDNTGDDIFIAAWSNGKFGAAHALPESVNSAGDDFNAFIDPEENYIIFSSYKRKDDLGKGDLYYCLREKGDWLPAVHFPAGINSPALDYSPFVSADRRYFFFTSKRSLLHFPYPESKSATEIRALLNRYGNGFEDVYIMDFKAIWKQ